MTPARLSLSLALCLALLALAIWIGAAAFAADRAPGLVHTYAALVLISLAITALCEVLLTLADPDERFMRLAHVLPMATAGLLMALVYGPQMFVKYYTGDDWFFIAFQYQAFDWEFVNAPISNHYVPLLNVIYRLMSMASDPTYFGNALLFYFSCMLVVAGMARIVVVQTGRAGIAALAAVSFAIWPTFEGARTYFSGGFWLALPVGTFLALILVVRRMLLAAAPTTRDHVALAVLALFTVLTSSQILIPLVFVFAYALPLWEAADTEGRRRLVRRGMGMAVILLLPTVVATAGRFGLPKVNPDFSGLIDGSYFTNLALLIKTKVGFDKVSTTLLVLVLLIAGFRLVRERWQARNPGQFPELALFLLVLAAAGLTMPKGAFSATTAPLWIAGLLLFGTRALARRIRSGPPAPALASPDTAAMSLCGLAMLLFFVLQVGVGRRWNISTALADYYAMFPMAGMWLVAAGALALRPAGLRWREAAVAIAALGAVFAFAVTKYLPDAAYVAQIGAQRAFVRDLGVASCSEAGAIGAGQRLLLRERYPAGQCRTCGQVLWIPEGLFEGGFFSTLARASAEWTCPALANRLVVTRDGAALESTGSTAATRDFYARHYAIPAVR